MANDAKEVVMFIGPPGSGKDTQANLLVQEFGMVQVVSSQLLREAFAANPTDPQVMHERALFDEGKLNSPEFVSRIVMAFVRAQAQAGKSLIFSGSPRTMYEAQEDVVVLPELYGAEHITLLHMNLDKEEAKRRIASRRFCRAHSHPIPGTPEFAHLKACPQDGSELYVRPLDNPELLDTRFDEYRQITEPCLPFLAEKGFTVFEIDGSKTILGIHQEIIGILERHKSPVSPI